MTDREHLYQLTIAIGNAFAAASSGMQVTNTIEEAADGARGRLMRFYEDACSNLVKRKERGDAAFAEYASINIEEAVFVMEWLKQQQSVPDAEGGEESGA